MIRNPCDSCLSTQKCLQNQCYALNYCFSTADCSNYPYSICINNLCQVPNPQPTCRRDVDCPRNYQCVNWQCVGVTPPPSSECQTDRQCQYPKKCFGGWCRLACRFDCAIGYKCYNGECVSQSYCQIDNDCPSNQYCSNNYCVVQVPVPIPIDPLP